MNRLLLTVRNTFAIAAIGVVALLVGVVALIAGGVVLVVLPMTVSRWVFSLCGLVMTIVGVVMLLERLKERKFLDDGGDPNIIDAL